MFDALSSKFGDILESLTRKGTLSEEDVGVAMREIRVALLEADVSLSVVKEFIEVVGQKAIGQDVVKSITPGQMVIKIVHDQLIEMLGSEDAEINFRASPPVPILIVGLQGAGKTTTAGKLALRLTKHDGKKVLLAGLDVVRPAAQEQLQILGGQAGVLSLKPVFGEQPIGIAKRAILLIQPKDILRSIVGHVNVGPSITVVVSRHHAKSWAKLPTRRARNTEINVM